MTMYQVEQYHGTDDGWEPVSQGFVDQVTAVRRLRLYRACRGDQSVFRITRDILDVDIYGQSLSLDVSDFPFAFSN